MPTTPTYRVMTEPQRRLFRQIEDLAAAVVRFARRSASWRRQAADMGARLDALDAAHPDYVHADLRQRVLHWVSMLALAGAACLDAVLAAPVAEHLLTSYAHVTATAASIGRFAAPLFLIVAELGIGLAWRTAVRDRGWRNGMPWAALGILPVFVMPILVGETERVAAAVRQAQAANVSVSQAGLFDGPIPLFTLAMMAFTAFIHIYVVYGPHHESATYALWSIRTSSLRSGKKNADERERRDGNTAGDRFSQYVARRDECIATYPSWPLGSPNWSEAPDVLERVFGYPVITGSSSQINPNVQGVPPAGAPVAPPPAQGSASTPVPPIAGASGVASPKPIGPESADLHNIMEQRIRESDAAVSL